MPGSTSVPSRTGACLALPPRSYGIDVYERLPSEYGLVQGSEAGGSWWGGSGGSESMDKRRAWILPPPPLSHTASPAALPRLAPSALPPATSHLPPSHHLTPPSLCGGKPLGLLSHSADGMVDDTAGLLTYAEFLFLMTAIAGKW